MDKKSNENKIFKLFFRRAKEHTENTEIKVNIDIFMNFSGKEMLQSCGIWFISAIFDLND